MAWASAAVKLGSLVKEDAICSTKNCPTSGESVLGFDCLASLLVLDFAKSRVTLGPDGRREAEAPGCEPRVIQRVDPDVASS